MKPWIRLTATLHTWFRRVEAKLCHRGTPPGAVHCRHVVDLILDYAEGSLDPDERQAFEAHIADCPNCWRFLRSYRETMALGRQLRIEDVPPDVRERLEAFVRNRLQRPSSSR
jgi:anti-sigma factor RsiW